MTLEQLKALLKEKIAGIAELKSAVTAEDATKDAQDALEKHLKEIEDLKSKIKSLEDAERLEAEAAQAPDAPVGTQSRTAAQPIKDMDAMEKIGHAMAGLLKSHKVNGDKSWRGAADILDKSGYGAVAEEFDTRNKAMNSVTGSAGGFAVPEDFNEEIFAALAPYTAFLQGGPEIIPMPNGNYRQSGEAARPTASYRAEGSAIAHSEPTLREINMSSKLLSGLVPMTNQIINYTQTRAAAMARRSLATAMGLTMDATAFEGTGLGNIPLGIFNVVGINTDAAAAGTTPTQAVVDASVRPMINQIELYRMLGISVRWIMAQRVFGYLQDMKDGNGNYVYPGLQGDNPMFKGYPVLKPGTITTTGGAGTNETTIGLVSFGNILMGESGGLNIAISDEATYVDGGTTISAFQNDLTLIRSTMEHDWTPRYNEAVNTLTAVQWGA